MAFKDETTASPSSIIPLRLRVVLFSLSFSLSTMHHQCVCVTQLYFDVSSTVNLVGLQRLRLVMSLEKFFRLSLSLNSCFCFLFFTREKNQGDYSVRLRCCLVATCFKSRC